MSGLESLISARCRVPRPQHISVDVHSDQEGASLETVQGHGSLRIASALQQPSPSLVGHVTALALEWPRGRPYGKLWSPGTLLQAAEFVNKQSDSCQTAGNL